MSKSNVVYAYRLKGTDLFYNKAKGIGNYRTNFSRTPKLYMKNSLKHLLPNLRISQEQVEKYNIKQFEIYKYYGRISRDQLEVVKYELVEIKCEG